MRIYDCFTFFNELEVLEIRLNELYPVVDYFVLVEARQTYQGTPKPLYYLDNVDQFRQFRDKIIHVIVEFPSDDELIRQYPGISLPWAREYFQRDMIIKGLTNCRDDDIVIISDVDEIPRPNKIREFACTKGVKIFEQRLYYYWLNCECIVGPNKRPYRWLGSAMLQFRDLRSPQDVRNLVIATARELVSPRPWVRLGARALRELRGLIGRPVVIVPDGGWHFSYLGGAKRIIEKIKAFAHTEVPHPGLLDETRIKMIIESGQDLYGRDFKFEFINLDDSFPRYVVNHIDKWKHLIWFRDLAGEAGA
jgi:hypothetical protein